MSRGRLRVMLGAAPGVGKTFAMLEEARRLRQNGKDVVVGVVETHDRPATSALLEGFEVLPKRMVTYRGVSLQEMDLAAIFLRRPDVALVDELAHTNAPGSTHEKRWQDVDGLLDAGIDVLSTVNIQHIESLNDVVRQITGVPQHETIPDAALRRADQIELVDLPPQALRDRLTDGLVYPETRVDAALSNYFRLGNLTALRELALLWLADEVDVALQAYRAQQGIDAPWEARERIVVALTGGPEGETLLRRGARIAARSGGGQLFAVHVTSADGLAEGNPAALDAQRALIATLGGSYHHVVADQIPTALVEFARSVNATQLVIGVSRRSRLESIVGGAGIGANVIRLSGDIDVHIVSHAQAGKRRLPNVGGALSLRRKLIGFVLVAVGLPVLTLALIPGRSPATLTTDVLVYQLFVVIVAVVGGIWPALVAAIGAAFCLDYFFVPPLYVVRIAEPLHFVTLIFFLIVAVIVSLVVDQTARRTRAANRSAAESEVLVSIASGVIGGKDAIEALVERLREAFGMTSVALVENGVIVSSSLDEAAASPSDEETTLPLGTTAELKLRGKTLAASDRKILGAFVSQLESALERRRLTAEAEGIAPLAAADRMRSALLAAVGHDLRRPLAAATAAVTALRSTEVTLSKSDRAELLETADESLTELAKVITDLLDVSRLQAGVLGVTLEPVALKEVLGDVLDELRLAPGAVQLDLGEVQAVSADPALLQRVLVNLLANALRYSPAGSPPVVTTSEFGDRVQIRVIDRGPGIPTARREEVFLPFQRLGDTDNTAGIGLGLALAKGFVEGMGGTLEAEDTPGGGLTMVVELGVAA
jgi:two-component system, OmpR family, sensor histidine kinase KdpD